MCFIQCVVLIKVKIFTKWFFLKKTVLKRLWKKKKQKKTKQIENKKTEPLLSLFPARRPTPPPPRGLLPHAPRPTSTPLPSLLPTAAHTRVGPASSAPSPFRCRCRPGPTPLSRCQSGPTGQRRPPPSFLLPPHAVADLDSPGRQPIPSSVGFGFLEPYKGSLGRPEVRSSTRAAKTQGNPTLDAPTWNSRSRRSSSFFPAAKPSPPCSSALAKLSYEFAVNFSALRCISFFLGGPESTKRRAPPSTGRRQWRHRVGALEARRPPSGSPLDRAWPSDAGSRDEIRSYPFGRLFF